MGKIQQIADESGASQEGVQLTTGKLIIAKQAEGELNTAMGASLTKYFLIGIVPKDAELIECTVRTEAAGVAAGTIDILKAASGTAITAGTAMITQIAGNTPVAATNYKAAVNSNGTQVAAAGSAIVLKVVTGAAETLKPPMIRCIFKM